MLPADRRLTLVAYSAGSIKNAYIQPVSVADSLPEMAVFLEPDHYVPLPLEAPYRAAVAAVPRRWRNELERPPG